MNIAHRIAAMSIIAITLISCGASPAVARPPLKFGWIVWPGWYPLIIARDTGIFTKHGLAIEPVFYDSYAAIPADLAAGKLDGTLTGLYDILQLPKLSELRVVLVTDNSDGAEGLVADINVPTIADLRGKRVGVMQGSIGEFFLRSMLAHHQIDVKAVTIVPVEPEQIVAQLGNTVDAGYTWQPFVGQALAQQRHMLASTADLPGLVPDVAVFSSAAIATRRADVQAFVNSWFEALDYWQAHPAEANALIAQATKQPVAEVSSAGAKLFSRADNQRAFQPGSDTTSLQFAGQRQVDFLVTTGSMRLAPDLAQLLDSSFIKP